MSNFVSIRDINRSFEAHNVPVAVLADAVRPWFLDYTPEIEDAIRNLSAPAKQKEAMSFLGIEFI